MAEEDYADWRDDPELPPKLDEYCFSVNVAGVVRAMDKIYRKSGVDAYILASG